MSPCTTTNRATLPRLHEMAAQLIADGWPPLAAWAEARDRLAWLALCRANEPAPMDNHA